MGMSGHQRGTQMTDRTARYTARLDSHLQTLAADKREAFLKAEFAKWEERYVQFQRDAADDSRELQADGPDAHDFFSTICEIGKRLDACKVSA